MKAAAAAIVRKAREYAHVLQRPILMNLDVPPSSVLRNSYLQKTLISIRKHVENLANWNGIYLSIKPYPSTRCPYCGGKLKFSHRTKRARVGEATGRVNRGRKARSPPARARAATLSVSSSFL